MKMSPMEKTAREIAQRLRAADHIAYFAGGCVRDMVRGLAAKDFDIATDATPDIVQKIFPTLTLSARTSASSLSSRMDSILKLRHFDRTARIWTTVIPSMFDFRRRKKTRSGAILPSTGCSSIRRRTK